MDGYLPIYDVLWWTGGIGGVLAVFSTCHVLVRRWLGVCREVVILEDGWLMLCL
jgi:hypothetical protein